MSNAWQFPIAREIQLHNRVDELERLNEWLEAVGEEAGWPPRAKLDLSLACEELIVNIVNYGFPAGGEHYISVSVSASPLAAELKIEDAGVPFNPLEEADPDRSLELEDRDIGGLGIFFVKQLMDDIHYERTDERNRFRMSKTFSYINKKTNNGKQEDNTDEYRDAGH
ncbi:ATP-binding protein [Paenibacillus gorillae]|uniref:ATP-binding protein n=1 Tax=Paenibacillus gorillae TaxID=1243662 RepID=UPI0004BBFF42|nr:ATP-binding protein [Paenibacillus gorillae]